MLGFIADRMFRFMGHLVDCLFQESDLLGVEVRLTRWKFIPDEGFRAAGTVRGRERRDPVLLRLLSPAPYGKPAGACSTKSCMHSTFVPMAVA